MDILGHELAVDLLLKRGAFINVLDNDDQSPLYLAVEEGNILAVELLLKNSANVINGLNPIDVAINNGILSHEIMLEMLFLLEMHLIETFLII